MQKAMAAELECVEAQVCCALLTAVAVRSAVPPRGLRSLARPAAQK